MSTEPTPERLTFFSDAVIAIAMTLLALELTVPRGNTDREVWHDFASNFGNEYFPFLLSFVVIAAFWHAHHQLFRRITAVGPWIVPLNFGFLLMIVALPFVTRVLGQDGDFQIGPVLYAAVVAATAGFLALIAVRARQLGDVREEEAEDMRSLLYAMLGTAAMFAVSIPVGFADPGLATWSWLVLAIVTRGGTRVWRLLPHRDG
jgi:uncharacterized membrane protein